MRVRCWHCAQQRLRLLKNSWPSTAAILRSSPSARALLRLRRWWTGTRICRRPSLSRQGVDAADGVDAGRLRADQAAQPRGEVDEVLFQAVEAGAVAGEQGEDAGEDGGAGDLRLLARVGEQGQQFAEVEALVDVATKTVHHGERSGRWALGLVRCSESCCLRWSSWSSCSWLRSWSCWERERPLSTHCADGLFQGAGDVQQSPSAAVADSQIQGAVQLAALAAAGGFAAGAGAFDQGAAQEGLLGDQLGESGTGVAFGGRALRALAHGVSSAVLT